jgi:hypothetical protein
MVCGAENVHLTPSKSHAWQKMLRMSVDTCVKL